MTSMNLGLWSP